MSFPEFGPGENCGEGESMDEQDKCEQPHGALYFQAAQSLLMVQISHTVGSSSSAEGQPAEKICFLISYSWIGSGSKRIKKTTVGVTKITQIEKQLSKSFRQQVISDTRKYRIVFTVQSETIIYVTDGNIMYLSDGC
jgi:hypothetical protein